MPIYNSNILPGYTSWQLLNGASITDNDLSLNTGASAVYTYSTTGFEADNYMLITTQGVTGDVYLCLSYVDDNEVHLNNVIKLVANTALPIILNSATVDDLIFTLYSLGAASISAITAQLIEQAIRSVDIEYASGTSQTTPPEDSGAWSTNPPTWQTSRYIWQRTATTFVDGHIEYSSPVCIQNSYTAGIYDLEEEYYLSTSNTEPIGGTWTPDGVAWESGKYIWTRSKITWTSQEVTYTDPVLAQALNQANEFAQEAIDDVEELDKSLTQQEVFNRLTNDGQSEGLYLDEGNVYINATYIRSGRFEVTAPAIPGPGDEVIFFADRDQRSVYLAGFSAEAYSLTSGAISSKDSTAPGVWIGYKTESGTGTVLGTGGITCGNGASYVSVADGYIYGANVDNGEAGYISFDYTFGANYDNNMCIASSTAVAFLTSMIGVGDYAAHGFGGSWYEGQTGWYQGGMARLDTFAHPIPYNMRLGGGNVIYYDSWLPEAYYPTFTKGILTGVIN